MCHLLAGKIATLPNVAGVTMSYWKGFKKVNHARIVPLILQKID